ncbi:SYF2-domain-containing protein [Tothia fuscella]|uniref:Pre-mRNA-splicing factor SYF2 n=1 Tax=Tothia fuscella TaxID=1048955 RepID=A0A9P4TZM3_9PEZI|nr:SYF2-domain-containing protein [Tothia fuscella]
MPPKNKRKAAAVSKNEGESAKRRFVESEPAKEDAEEPVEEAETHPVEPEAETEVADGTPSEAVPAVPTKDAGNDRMARFKALQARQNKSKEQNLKASRLEAQRVATDPNLLNSLNRKHAIASHKLLKADTVAAGEDFERKRAWDWTVDESEKWDKRIAKKDKHKQDVAFQDYTQEARKTYKRQMRNFQPDLAAYQKKKLEAIEEAAANGGLEIVETEDGELIAVDRDGSFYSTADSTEFAKNKPDKAAVDRLVKDLQQAEEKRLAQSRKRNEHNDDGGDVTYINIKNKQFNEKLKRFYDKYTGDIRESFERGTAI